jgi:hypothetical protein
MRFKSTARQQDDWQFCYIIIQLFTLTGVILPVAVVAVTRWKYQNASPVLATIPPLTLIAIATLFAIKFPPVDRVLII